MSVTHIHYDEKYFSSPEQCLAEIARRLQHGWVLSDLTATRGRTRAVFSWHDARGRGEGSAALAGGAP